MYRSLINTFNYSFAESANILIYRLKKIPIIGERIPDSLYCQFNMKIVLGIIQTIFNLIVNFGGKLLYFYIFIFYPSKFFMNKFQLSGFEDIFLQIFFLMNFIYGSIFNEELFQNKAKHYKMIKFMRISAKEYYLGILLYKLISQFVFYSIILLVFKIYNPFIIMIELSAFRLLGEWINIIIFDKYKVVLGKKELIVGLCMIIVCIVSYVPIIFNFVFDFKSLLNNYVTLGVSIILLIVLMKKLYKKDDYKLIANSVLNRSSLVELEDIYENANFQDVKMKDAKVSNQLEYSTRFNSREGYDYLNSIFFYRDKKSIKNAIKIKSIVITIAFLVINFLIMFVGKKNKSDIDLIKIIEPSLIIIMNYLCNTEKICKSMFFNCDMALLRYGFYRSPKGILDNFKCRVKKILVFNLIPTLFLLVGVTISAYVIGKMDGVIRIMPILIAILSLYFFFTMYGLVLYYVLQPYTADLKIKSEAFIFLNNGISFLGLGCLKFKLNSIYFTILIIIITIIFVPLSFYLIYKLAPKRFKIR